MPNQLGALSRFNSLSDSFCLKERAKGCAISGQYAVGKRPGLAPKGGGAQRELMLEKVRCCSAMTCCTIGKLSGMRFVEQEGASRVARSRAGSCRESPRSFLRVLLGSVSSITSATKPHPIHLYTSTRRPNLPPNASAMAPSLLANHHVGQTQTDFATRTTTPTSSLLPAFCSRGRANVETQRLTRRKIA